MPDIYWITTKSVLFKVPVRELAQVLGRGRVQPAAAW
jgi:hypothetical protein